MKFRYLKSLQLMTGFLGLAISLTTAFNLIHISSASAQSNYNQPVQTVQNVDLSRFLGRWYQMARNPLFFEPANCPCAQQTLSLNSSNVVEVYNSCNKNSVNGKLVEISGTATSQDPVSNSKFSVDFGFFFKGQYWIIAIAPDYSWAVVTDPNRWSLYVLSKTPTLSSDQYEAALNEAKLQIDISDLKVTDHTNCVYP